MLCKKRQIKPKYPKFISVYSLIVGEFCLVSVVFSTTPSWLEALQLISYLVVFRQYGFGCINWMASTYVPGDSGVYPLNSFNMLFFHHSLCNQVSISTLLTVHQEDSWWSNIVKSCFGHFKDIFIVSLLSTTRYITAMSPKL